MEKKTGFILYFDILGYRDIIKKGTKEQIDYLARIIEQFSDYYSEANVSFGYGLRFDNSKLLTRAFSDNFLYLYESAETDYMNLAILQSVASRIQYQFLCAGLLTRGAITYGEIAYNDIIVFGKAVVRAVELEESHREPSIVVDETLKHTFDGINDIAYEKEVCPFDVWPNSKLDYEDCRKGIESYIKSLENEYPDPKVLAKIEWIIERFNQYFDEAKKHPFELRRELHLALWSKAPN